MNRPGLAVFCDAARYVAFSKAVSHIRSVSVFERHITIGRRRRMG
jgi:hypothetical protein